MEVEVDEGAGDEDVDDGEGIGDYAVRSLATTTIIVVEEKERLT